jgi:Fe-S-cluster containining protein
MEISYELRRSVIAASLRPEVRQAVGRIYEELSREIEQRQPVCVMSGKCCRFDEYGHRLYVTTAELGAFAAELEVVRTPTLTLPRSTRGGERMEQERGCPFQVGRMCGVHGIRPMGCRVFFCDPSAGEWQRGVYERMHGKLKQLHEELSIPYAYVEWRAACEVMGWTEIADCRFPIAE